MASRLDRRRFVLGGTSATAGALLAARNGRELVRAQEASPAASPMASPGASPVASPTMNTGVGGQLRYLVSASAQEEIRAIQNILSTTFRERYPNLEIQVEPAASGGSGDPLLTSMVAGEAPDIFDAWTSRATPYIAAGQVLDLKPFMERDYSPEALADFFPWVLTAQSLPNGFQWGMPRYVNLNVLCYNKDLVEQAGLPDPTAGMGWDHNAYRAALLKLTQKAGDRTRVYGGHVPVYFYGPFAEKVEAWGGSAVDPNDRTKATFDSPQGQECAEWHRVLMLDEKAIADKQFLDTGGGQGVIGALANFGAGRLASIETGFYPFSLADAVGDAFRFGIAPRPGGPGGNPVFGSADGFTIWNGSQNQEAAWEAVKFMSGPEYQAALMQSTGLIPVRRSLIPAYEQTVIQARPALADANLTVGLQLLEQNPHERPLFAKGGTDFAADAEVEDIVNAGLERIFVAANTPVAFLNELAQQVTAAMQS